MGLPGSGKTTLATELSEKYIPDSLWFNADEIRKKYNDWDFSHEGRLRQARRMRELSEESDNDYVMADFVAPLPEMREIYDADYTIWVNTLQESRFADTNSVFVAPKTFDFCVTTQDCEFWAPLIIQHINHVRSS